VVVCRVCCHSRAVSESKDFYRQLSDDENAAPQRDWWQSSRARVVGVCARRSRSPNSRQTLSTMAMALWKASSAGAGFDGLRSVARWR
jgi:hypothetical protein